MISAIRFTATSLPIVNDVYPETLGKWTGMELSRYFSGEQTYYFVHDTDRLQRNFVMTSVEVAMVYDISADNIANDTSFTRIY